MVDRAVQGNRLGVHGNMVQHRRHGRRRIYDFCAHQCRRYPVQRREGGLEQPHLLRVRGRHRRGRRRAAAGLEHTGHPRGPLRGGPPVVHVHLPPGRDPGPLPGGRRRRVGPRRRRVQPSVRPSEQIGDPAPELQFGHRGRREVRIHSRHRERSLHRPHRQQLHSRDALQWAVCGKPHSRWLSAGRPDGQHALLPLPCQRRSQGPRDRERRHFHHRAVGGNR
mmetsp:Transcript_107781/g.305461  ORF Transcript_107781/g.305461 Transcript_107781/m.305461 type:complete len:222 (-) Transcript_107781:3906-4571(-)